MPGTRALLPAILVVVAALAPGSLGDDATGGCAGRLSCRSVRLPAPITITSGPVSYRIGRDGRVGRIPEIPSPLPRGAAVFPATGTWFVFRHGHLVVGRGRNLLWRSHGRMARAQLGLIMASSRMVAFQHDHKLYLAPLRAAERPVAGREMPLGWTHGGLYTYRYAGRQLLLRGDTGALLKVIARRPLGSDYFVAGGRLYFVVHGVLMSARGPRIQRLASLAELRMSDAWLQPMGRLLELQDNRRLMVLRSDGSVFAWTPLPRGDRQTEGISSRLVLSPDASAVALTAASGETGGPASAQRAHGTETAYLLRAGARTATPVHTEHVAFGPCERGASLQWHGKWLLYGNSEGNLAVIDTTGARRAVELGRLVSRLPGTRNGVSAYWSGRPPEL